MAPNKICLFVSFLLRIQLSYSTNILGIERDSSEGTARGYFLAHLNHYLKVPVLRSVFVYDDIECSRKCLREINCFSFNLAVNCDPENNLHLCEILATTNYYAHENFKPHPSFHHFSTIRMSAARSCFDHLKRGATKNGLYTIQDHPQGDRENRLVYCDLTSEPGRAWTLVLSWKLANSNFHQFKRDHFNTNAPVNDENPNWDSYRLPLDVMTSLKSQSSLWRATCSFPAIKSNATFYSDYLRGNFRTFDLFAFVGDGICKKVDYVSIRGHVGISTEAQFWQRQGVSLHIDSCATGCAFKPNVGCVPSENNFGYYGEGAVTQNRLFRCTASVHETTNWWFGSE